MKPVETTVEVIKSGIPQITMRMDVSQKNIHKLIPLLRDSLYSDKMLAPIREYSTNARDAHIEKGIPNRPIQVTLPNRFDPVFRVRDFGNGLSMEQLRDTYFIYLESTKCDSNDYNGMLGLGSKSAFAYSVVFTVTTFHNGMKSIVICPITGVPTVDYSGPTDEENGVEIAVPVASKDVDSFVNKAMEFYKFWDIRPDFKGISQDTVKGYCNPIDAKPMFFGENWEIRPNGRSNYNSGNRSVAIMGFVPYPINWSVVKSSLPTDVDKNKLERIWNFIECNISMFRFNIGDIEFTPNRESLQYTEKTIKSICSILVTIHDRVIEIINDKIAKASNLWEAKLIYGRVFSGKLNDKDDESFDGDLSAIRKITCNKLMWNNIIINDADFDKVGEWDTTAGDTGYRRDVKNHVLQVYSRNSDTNKSVECIRPRRYDNRDIVVSPLHMVLICDVENCKYKQHAIRYLLFQKYPETQVKKIFVLNLYDMKVRAAFFKHYNFDSVPVTYISDLESEAKAYAKSNRAPRGSKKEDVEYSKLPLIYVDLKDQAENSGYNNKDVAWQKDHTLTPKSLDGGVFVIFDRGNVIVNGKEMNGYSANRLFNQLIALGGLTGNGLDRVYGLHKRTVEAAWFKPRLESGAWVSVNDFINNQTIEDSKAEMIRKAVVFSKTIDIIENDNYIGAILARKLRGKITDPDSLINDYDKWVCDNIENYLDGARVVSDLGLKTFDIPHSEKLLVLIKNINKTYPLIFQLDNSSSISNNRSKDNHYTVKDVVVTDIANYVNAMDSYNRKSNKGE